MLAGEWFVDSHAGILSGGRAVEERETGAIRRAHRNWNAAQLVEHAIRRREGCLTVSGALAVRTGQFTGRSPRDKYIVRDKTTESKVEWGPVNQPLSPAQFNRIYARMRAFWGGRGAYVQDAFVGADAEYAIPVRVVTEYAWHALFARQLFIPASPGSPAAGEGRGFTILFAPEFHTDPSEDGTNSETCICINFEQRLVLICGTSYAGEMKKAAFTIMNFLLPEHGVAPMHCAANVGKNGDAALFFGLSGTGKTTLSADPARRLIGDDEHGWSERGVFNFEGGCYAKCIHLSPEREPQIWNAIRFGAVLENVAMDAGTREIDFDSGEITENTRAAYPLSFIDNAVIPSVGGHPRNVVLLTADAFGVLPPISRLTAEQAMYHFLSGYTAKVAGTERGLGKEPQATFSACFGSPFLPRPAAEYAALLGEKLRRHGSACWLVNTGWVGGPYGVGHRMELRYTRAMLHAALHGKLADAPTAPDSTFRVAVPQSCPGVPAQLLDARGMWSDPGAYDRAARDLAGRFNQNFEKFSGVSPAIAAAAPVLVSRAG
ncbi:MAG: phosphoenolpyruvate carboxykinase (ATP) [Acidobacteriia bacterium]|nr:phosphoenolpyruvate carboxykinase (ATP) [Terriglobia bacterium]